MPQTELLRKALLNYAKGRKLDVKNGLETPALSALLLEKYAIGLVDAVRALALADVDINQIAAEADKLCRGIYPQYHDLRGLRSERIFHLEWSIPIRK